MLKINGTKIQEDPKEVAAIILSLPRDLQCWSKDGLERLLIGSLEMAIEIAREKKGGNRFISLTEKQIEKFRQHSPDNSREWVLSRIYDEILKSEGKSTLPGFGFANGTGNSEISPAKPYM